MNILHAIILGVVEGLTEFLPISSTAHLLIANRLLGLELTEFVKSFDVYIQLGAILAVVILYAKRFLADWSMIKKVIAAFIPTAIIGAFLYPVIKSVLLESLWIIAWALLLGGIAIIIFERWEKKRLLGKTSVSYKQSVGVGIFQALAVIPGVSRSAATIIGGLILGIDRKTIVEFSFLLAVPTMLAASGLDLIKSDFHFSYNEWWLIVVGFITAFLTALAAIKFFISYIQKHNFTAFGWYRIVVGALILLFLL